MILLSNVREGLSEIMLQIICKMVDIVNVVITNDEWTNIDFRQFLQKRKQRERRRWFALGP